MEAVEVLPYKVNVNQLVYDLENHIKKLGPPVFQGVEFGYNNFGGWGLLTRTGKYDDGFQYGFEKCWNKDGSFNHHIAKYLDYSHNFEHNNRSDACTDAIYDVLKHLEREGFYPRRARLTCLKANSSSIVHRDAPSEEYLVRIHIPIITNEKCIHWSEYGEFHMPADGSVYILPVNCYHQIRNESNEDRYHIIMDAYDTRGLTKSFKYNDDINVLIQEAEEYRRKIDETKIGFFRRMIYDLARHYYLFKFNYQQKRLKEKV